MEIIAINGKEHPIPNTLNELDTNQLLRVIETVFFRNVLEDNFMQMKVDILKAVTGWNDTFFSFWQADAAKACIQDCPMGCKEYCKENTLFFAELEPVVNIMDNFFEKVTKEDAPQQTYTLAPLLTLQKMPVLLVNKVEHHGPSDLLQDLSFDSWIEADLYYMKYMNTGKEAYLNKLFFSLYKIAPDTNRKLKKLHSKKLSKNQYDKYLNPIVRHAVLLFYMSSRNTLTKHFKSIFTAPQKGDKDAMNGWYKIKFTVAETGLFGDFDKVGEVKIVDMLSHLHLKKTQAIEAANESRIKANS